MKVKVSNMTSDRGNKIANQFVIEIHNGDTTTLIFQSYQTIIAKIEWIAGRGTGTITLDESAWNYSRTTAKYRNKFLGENTAMTQSKIVSGIYRLDNLNP